MNLFDCCCDCCSSIAGCECCSMDACCCPDCYGAGGLPGGIQDLVENWLENNVTVIGGSDYVLPTATKTIKGGVKVGHSLMMNGEGNEVLNVALDTISSSVEGFMWIHDVTESVSGGSVASSLNIADDADIAAMLDSVFSGNSDFYNPN